MEVIQHGDHRYTMQIYGSDGGIHAYVLQLNQPVGDARIPRFAQRYDLPDSFKTKDDAIEQAKRAANRLEKGELSFLRERIKKRVRDHELIGSASFRTGVLKWQPMVKIISHRERNKGAVQEIGDVDSSLARNLFDSPVTAAKYAMEVGERIVLGFIGGLRV